MEIRDFEINIQGSCSYTNAILDLYELTLIADVKCGRSNNSLKDFKIFCNSIEGEKITVNVKSVDYYKIEPSCTTIQFIVETVLVGEFIKSIDNLSGYNLRLKYKNADSFMHIDSSRVFNVKEDYSVLFRRDKEDLIVDYVFHKIFEFRDIHRYIVQVNALLSLCSDSYIVEDSVIIFNNKEKIQILQHKFRRNENNRKNLYFNIQEIDMTDVILKKWINEYEKMPQVFWSMYDYLGVKKKTHLELLAMFRNIEIIIDRLNLKPRKIGHINHTKLYKLPFTERTDFYVKQQKLDSNERFYYNEKIKLFLNLTMYIHELKDKQINKLAKQIKDRRNSFTHEGIDCINKENIEGVFLREYIYILLKTIIFEIIGIDKDTIKKSTIFHGNLIKNIRERIM